LGLLIYFFSRSGIPETLVIRRVIVSGPIIVIRVSGELREMRNIPHQQRTSPKLVIKKMLLSY
jgi:hypothetical protein